MVIIEIYHVSLVHQFLYIACNSDKSVDIEEVKTENTAPVSTITSHTNDVEINEGAVVTFEGVVFDEDHLFQRVLGSDNEIFCDFSINRWSHLGSGCSRKSSSRFKLRSCILSQKNGVGNHDAAHRRNGSVLYGPFVSLLVLWQRMTSYWSKNGDDFVNLHFINHRLFNWRIS